MTPLPLPLAISEQTDLAAPNAPSSLVKKLSYVALVPLFLLRLAPLLLWRIAQFAFGWFPVKSWPLGKVLYHALLNAFITTFLGLQLPLPATTAAEAAVPKHNVQDVSVATLVVQPVPPEDRIGFAKHSAVDAVTRPGFMLTPSGAKGRGLAGAKPDEKVILYHVGGAFVMGHPLRTTFAKATSQATGLRLFAVNYRKALSSSSAFPAPLLDALAGYKYLVSILDFKPENIVIMGDSAGANLSLALVRYLAELKSFGRDIGMPQTLLLNSAKPWADMTSAMPSCKSNAVTDYVGGLGHLAVPSYTRHFPSFVKHAYFSPALADASDLSYVRGLRTYIQTGTKELLYDEDVALHEKLSEAGALARLREDVGGTHCNAILGYRQPLEQWLKDVKEVVGSG